MNFTNRPVKRPDGSVPPEYYDADYWDNGAASGKGSYNGNDYSNNLEMCKYWARDCYNRWGPFETYLELGCGKGWAVWGYLHMPDLAVKPIGVDISHYALETTVDEVKPYLVEHDASDLGFIRDLSTDFVFSNDFFEHLTEDQINKCIGHCARVTKHRMVHLVSIGDGQDHSPDDVLPEQDQSHVTMRSSIWWLDKFKSILGTEWLITMLRNGGTIEIDAIRKEKSEAV